MTLPQAIAWRPASFRGAPFGVDDTERGGGRRGPVHQVPKSDAAAAEDMGLKAPEFSFKGYVYGDDYQARRDRLIAALEAEGPGELVHPHFGALLCKVDGYTCREQSSKLGFAEFSFKLIRVGDNTFPSARRDSSVGLLNARDAARSSIAGDFAARFSVQRQPDFVSRQAQGQVEQLHSLARWRQRVGDATRLVQDPGALAYRIIDNLSGGQLSFVGNEAAATVGTMRGVALLRPAFGTGGAGAWANAIRAGLSWQSYRPASSNAGITWSTPARSQAAQNDAALASLVQRAALLAVADAVQVAEPPTRQAAYALRPEIAAGFDLVERSPEANLPQSNSNGSSLYLAMAALRTATLTHLAERGGAAGEGFTLELDAPLSVLALTNRLYGDADDAGRSYAASVLARNPGQRDPGALRGQMELIANG